MECRLIQNLERGDRVNTTLVLCIYLFAAEVSQIGSPRPKFSRQQNSRKMEGNLQERPSVQQLLQSHFQTQALGEKKVKQGGYLPKPHPPMLPPWLRLTKCKQEEWEMEEDMAQWWEDPNNEWQTDDEATQWLENLEYERQARGA